MNQDLNTTRRNRMVRQFGDFIIDKELWRSEQSTVYLARAAREKCAIALKVLYPRAPHTIKEILRGASREAAILREIKHENIVPLYRAGEFEGVPYLSFLFIQGLGLDQILKNRRPEPAEVLAWMSAVARAVHHAHGKGIFHRDLKPRNILIDDAGKPHVLDWGLAWRKGDISEKGVQKIIGAPAYMSPEQARGEEERLTPAADVYSLGAILYQLVTGKPPFEAETSWKTLQMAMSLPPQPPTELNSALDPRIEKVIMTCLSKDPGQRYSSAGALADDIDRVIENKEPRGPGGLLGRLFS